MPVPQPVPWSTVANDPRYKSLAAPDQEATRRKYVLAVHQYMRENFDDYNAEQLQKYAGAMLPGTKADVATDAMPTAEETRQSQAPKRGIVQQAVTGWREDNRNEDLSDIVSRSVVSGTPEQRQQALQVYREGNKAAQAVGDVGVVGNISGSAHGMAKSLVPATVGAVLGSTVGATKLGWRAGQTEYWAKRGIADIYDKASARGVPDDIARAYAVGGGTLYGASEQLFDVPGFAVFGNKVVQATANKLPEKVVRSTIAKTAAKWGIGTGMEASEESVQGFITDLSVELAASHAYLAGYNIPESRNPVNIGQRMQEFTSAIPVAGTMVGGAMAAHRVIGGRDADRERREEEGRKLQVTERVTPPPDGTPTAVVDQPQAEPAEAAQQMPALDASVVEPLRNVQRDLDAEQGAEQQRRLDEQARATESALQAREARKQAYDQQKRREDAIRKIAVDKGITYRDAEALANDAELAVREIETLRAKGVDVAEAERALYEADNPRGARQLMAPLLNPREIRQPERPAPAPSPVQPPPQQPVVAPPPAAPTTALEAPVVAAEAQKPAMDKRQAARDALAVKYPYPGKPFDEAQYNGALDAAAGLTGLGAKERRAVEDFLSRVRKKVADVPVEKPATALAPPAPAITQKPATELAPPAAAVAPAAGVRVPEPSQAPRKVKGPKTVAEEPVAKKESALPDGARAVIYPAVGPVPAGYERVGDPDDEMYYVAAELSDSERSDAIGRLVSGEDPALGDYRQQREVPSAEGAMSPLEAQVAQKWGADFLTQVQESASRRQLTDEQYENELTVALRKAETPTAPAPTVKQEVAAAMRKVADAIEGKITETPAPPDPSTLPMPMPEVREEAPPQAGAGSQTPDNSLWLEMTGLQRIKGRTGANQSRAISVGDTFEWGKQKYRREHDEDGKIVLRGDDRVYRYNPNSITIRNMKRDAGVLFNPTRDLASGGIPAPTEPSPAPRRSKLPARVLPGGQAGEGTEAAPRYETTTVYYTDPRDGTRKTPTNERDWRLALQQRKGVSQADTEAALVNFGDILAKNGGAEAIKYARKTITNSTPAPAFIGSRADKAARLADLKAGKLVGSKQDVAAEVKALEAELGGRGKTPAKEPWEMSATEFADNIPSRDWFNRFGWPEGYSYSMGNRQYAEKTAHQAIVQKAIRSGKPVPPEVLADYPDLAPKVEKPAKEPWEMTNEERAVIASLQRGNTIASDIAEDIHRSSTMRMEAYQVTKTLRDLQKRLVVRLDLTRNSWRIEQPLEKVSYPGQKEWVDHTPTSPKPKIPASDRLSDEETLLRYEVPSVSESVVVSPTYPNAGWWTKMVRFFRADASHKLSFGELAGRLDKGGYPLHASALRALPTWLKARELVMTKRREDAATDSYQNSIGNYGLLHVNGETNLHELGHYVFDSLPLPLRREAVRFLGRFDLAASIGVRPEETSLAAEIKAYARGATDSVETTTANELFAMIADDWLQAKIGRTPKGHPSIPREAKQFAEALLSSRTLPTVVSGKAHESLAPKVEKPAPAKNPAPKSLIPEADMPFNLVGQKKPAERPIAASKASAPEQPELFAVQEVAKIVDPELSANAAEKQYGGPAEAVAGLTRQLAAVDANKDMRKAFTKKQRARLKEVMALLRERADNPRKFSDVLEHSAADAKRPRGGISELRASRVLARRFPEAYKAGVIKVVRSAYDIPAEVLPSHDPVNIRGWYDPREDTAYVVAGNALDEADLADVAAHELVGHRGVLHVLGPRETVRIMERLNAEHGDTLRRLASEQGIALTTNDGSPRAAAEVLADLAGKLDGELLQQPSYKRLWNRLVTMVRMALAKVGYRGRVTEPEIRDLLTRAQRTAGEPMRDTVGARDVFGELNREYSERQDAGERDEPDGEDMRPRTLWNRTFPEEPRETPVMHTLEMFDAMTAYLNANPDAVPDIERDFMERYTGAADQTSLAARGVALEAYYDTHDNPDGVRRITEFMDPLGRGMGRNVQMLSYWRDALRGEAWGRDADAFAKEFGTQFTQDEKDKFRAMFAAARKLTAGSLEREEATQAAVDAVARRVGMKWRDWYDAFRYMNMLSGPATHGRNIASAVLNGMVLRPAMLAASGDFSTLKYYHGMKKSLPGAMDAYMKAWRGLGTESWLLDQPNMTAFEAARRRVGPKGAISGKVWAGMNAITRFLEAQDQFFKHIIQTAESIRLVETGEVARLQREDPMLFEDQQIAKLDRRAERLANLLLFREAIGSAAKDPNEVALVRVLDKLAMKVSEGRKSKEALIRYPMGLLVPFLRTPMAMVKLGVRMSPMGYKRGQSADMRALANIGTGVMALAGAYALAGLTAGAPPKDEEERERWYATGRKAWSVYVPGVGKGKGVWVPMAYLGPAMIPFGFATAIHEKFMEDPQLAGASALEKTADAFTSMAKLVSTQMPLQGVYSAVRVLAGDESFQWNKFSAYTLGQFVPLEGFNRWVAHIVDPTFRKSKGFWDTMQRDIPWASKSLPAHELPPEHRGDKPTPAPRHWTGSVAYEFGQNRAQYDKPLAERRALIRMRRINDAALDELAADIKAGKAKIGDAVARIAKAKGAAEQARLRSRFKEKYPELHLPPKGGPRLPSLLHALRRPT